MDIQKAAKTFKTLCDPKRLEILTLLQEGETCACQLLDRLHITQPGLSYHMKILCESGIVASRQDGKWTHYRLDKSGRGRVIELLLEITTPKVGQENYNECGCSG